MSTAAENIQLVKDAINALNTGDTTKVSELSVLHTLIMNHRWTQLDQK
jgi:hypothetical protein